MVAARIPPEALRLTASRERLRLALRAVPSRAAAGAAPEDLPAWLAGWTAAAPEAAALLAAAHRWWRTQPLHQALAAGGEVASALLRPWAQRHPLRLAAGAVCLGAALAWSRPWRWRWLAPVLAGALPGLAARVLRQVPLEGWLSALGALWPSPPSTPASPTAPDLTAGSAGSADSAPPPLDRSP